MNKKLIFKITVPLWLIILWGVFIGIIMNNKSKCSISQPTEDYCMGVFWWYVFDESTNMCEYENWWCGNPPFKTLEKCESVCK